MKKLFLVLSLLSFAFNAQAVSIDLLPDHHMVAPGSPVNLQVRINGLNDASAPALGDYDLNLSYDASLLQVAAITWGNQLDLAGFGSLQDANTSIAGVINLFEISFDDSWLLNNTQAGSFTLFNVVFNTLAAGSAMFSLDVNAIGDAYGNSLTLDAVNNAQVDITRVNAPEPASWLLLLGGLGLLALRAINRVK